ncbi:MAG: FtsH protease activity modulator HflK [Oscillospiraceae bacterium]|nr:FtsH protease activity modulator HflK [Oscillospiraceae bacterium]
MDLNDLKNMRGGASGGGGPKKVYDAAEKKRIKTTVIVIAILIIAAIIVFTSMFTVNDKQQAVITTFGRVTGTPVSSGLHFKLPFGIQKAHTVDVNVYQKVEIGYQSFPNGTSVSVTTESKMITGDYNIVNVDFFVEYKVSDPVQYLFASRNPEIILKNVAQGQIRNVISSYLVDDILTTGKLEIQSKVREAIMSELDSYQIGLILTEIRIQDAEPPTEEVIAAFKSVESAKQNKETTINQANAYKEQQLPVAKADADQKIQNAEYLRQNRINDAIKQVAMFEAMYAQYTLNPLITRERMFYEAMEQLMPGIRVYINTTENETSMLLPLDSFMGGDTQ